MERRPCVDTISMMDTITFATPKAFEKWLKVHHDKAPGVWVRFLKKDYKAATGEKSVTYAEALDVALCYGWIDSIVHTIDDQSYKQKFSPRGAKSVWSKRNREHVARLIKEKRMTAHGLRHVAAAKKDGRWDQAYGPPSSMAVPEDFLKDVHKNKKAKAFFDTLNRANLYAIAFRLHTAKKPETRARRAAAILSMLESGKKFH